MEDSSKKLSEQLLFKAKNAYDDGAEGTAQKARDYAEGYKVREIAAMLRLTASAVKMRLQKGRQLLQQMQEEQEEESHE